MRICLTLLACVLVAFPATAQTDYKTVADSTSLTDNGTLADVDISCMAQMPSGDFVFYNFPTGDLVTHNPNAAPGSRTAILRANADIDSDLNSDAESCFAITVDESGNVYAALQDSTNTDQIYKTDGSGGSVLAEADGMTGIAVSGSTVYLARVAFFGAPEDGFYSINTTSTGQTPAVVITEADLDLVDLAVGSDGSLYASSSEFGGGIYDGAVVKVTDPDGTPSLSVVYDPFVGGDEIFTNESDGGLEDIELAPGATDRLYLFNNSFGAAGGEQWGTVLADGTGGEQFADQAAMIADGDTDLTEFTPPGGRSMVLDGDEIYVASRSSFGGQDQIVQFSNFPPTANFEVKVSGVPPTVAQGGSFMVNYVIYNNSNNPAPGQIYFKAKRNGNTLAEGTIQSGTLPAGQSFSGSYTQGVPGVAPAGDYTYEVSIGPNRNVAISTEVFDVTVVAAARVAGGAATWSVADATPWVFEGESADASSRAVTVGAYPNPFARSTEIGFSLERASDVSLVVYDVRGREVVTLADGTMDAGQHSVTFDASSLPSGVYVYRLVTGTQVETGRVTLVK